MCHQDNIDVIGQLDIDYMGFIFFDKSPRAVKKKLDLSSLTNVQKIGVFVNEDKSRISEIVDTVELDIIQLHGDESPSFCEEIRNLGVKVIKAFNVESKADFEKIYNYKGVINYLLFDKKGDVRGGSGKSFNWDILQDYNDEIPFFLSGGIRPGSVMELRKMNYPQMHAIDINSRFEVRPGVKSELSLKSFIDELRS